MGTKAKVIVAPHVSDRDTHRFAGSPALVTTTAMHFDVAEASADKGYSSHRKVETLTDLGIVP